MPRGLLCRSIAGSTLLLALSWEAAAQRARGATPPVPGRRIALLIGTDVYTGRPDWSNLSNPVRDASTLAATLAKDFGFDTTVIRNATQAQTAQALNDLQRRATGPEDWVLVFIASHGHFDESANQGYLVFRDSRPLASDVALSSYTPLIGLLPRFERIGAGHVLLIIDACYAGTIDRDIRTGTDRGAAASGASHRELVQSLRRRSQYRSRQFLTSGGKEYVPDGGANGHSPFVSAMLAALREASVNASPLTFQQLLGNLDARAVTPLPRHGNFAGHESGADFIFVPNSFAEALVASPAEGSAPASAGRADPNASSNAAARAPNAAARAPSMPPAPRHSVRTVASSIDAVPGMLSTGASRGVEMLATSCTAGDGADCLPAARRVLLGHGTSRDDTRARMLLERGCTAGDPGACAEAALLDARDRGNTQRASAGASRLRQSCDGGDAHACSALARFWIGGGTGGSAGELLEVLRSACNTDLASACVYAALATPGAGTSRPPASMEALLVTGCRALEPTACAFLARLYVERDRSAEERELAARLADAACALYDPVACNLRAEQFMYGIAADLDPPRARTLAERTCAARSGEGCYLLGRLTEIGLGGPRDARAASRLYQQACTAGVRADCSRPLNPRTEIDWWRAVP